MKTVTNYKSEIMMKNVIKRIVSKNLESIKEYNKRCTKNVRTVNISCLSISEIRNLINIHNIPDEATVEPYGYDNDFSQLEWNESIELSDAEFEKNKLEHFEELVLDDIATALIYLKYDRIYNTSLVAPEIKSYDVDIDMLYNYYLKKYK